MSEQTDATEDRSEDEAVEPAPQDREAEEAEGEPDEPQFWATALSGD